MVGISRVCSEQQSSYSNKSFTFYSKLQERSKDGGNIRKKGKMEKATEFVERMKKVQEEVGAALKKT